jgi:CelD/BcsL family acetyltransferase involved in cellulose biosynthesis
MSTASGVFAILAGPRPASGLTCTVVTDPQELERLGPDWTNLLKRSADNRPMLAPVWLRAWWSVYGSDRHLRVGLFHDGTRLVGLAPLLARRCWHRRCLPFRRLEPLGADVDEGDGVGSDYLGPIAERGAEERVADALAEAIAAGRFGPCDEVILPVMDGDRPLPQLLTTAFCRAGFAAKCVQTGAAPYISLPSSWEAYLKGLSGSQRYYLRRSQRDFDEWAAGETSIEKVTNVAELAEGKRILIALHGERWAAAGQKGALSAARFAAFHDAVLPELLRAGALELLWLTVRGQPVAAVYNIVWDRKVLFYQSGRQPDVPHGIRPGIVLHAHAIRAAIKANCREYDFLGGESQYKAQLAPSRRPLVEVRAVRPSLIEHARRCMESAIDRTRSTRTALRRLLTTAFPSTPPS